MDHLSSSQINVYMLCGLKYKFQYIDNLPKLFKSSALIFGSAFHSALSWLYKEELAGREVSVEILYKIFDADWYSQKTDNTILYKEGETELGLMNLGKEFLGLYFQKPHKKIIGSEIPFSIPLVNPKSGEALPVNFEGFFDLIEEDSTVVDFKTSAHTMSQDDVDRHLQLTAYGYAFQILHGKPANGFQIINFVKGRKPKIVKLETSRDKSDFEGFFYLAKEVLKGIQSSVFYPHPGYWCKDCEYAFLCPLFEGKVEMQIPEMQNEKA